MNSINGLTNLGNTCFINTCIQILNYTPHWNTLLKEPKYIHSEDQSKVLLEEWNTLTQLMSENNCEISPNRFIYFIKEVSKVKNKFIFTDGSENDFTEFLIFFLDVIHHTMARKLGVRIPHISSPPPSRHIGERMSGDDGNAMILRHKMKIEQKCCQAIKTLYSTEYSEIVSMFYGLTYSIIYSKKKKRIYSIHPEPFVILHLPIPPYEGSTLEQCIEAYIAEEELIGENAWYNEKTQEKEDVIKKICFWSFPNICIISLKRFTEEHKTCVHFPLVNFNLGKYMDGKTDEHTPDTGDALYTLYAVANHFGNLSGGHYTAFIRIETQWVHFDDKSTTRIDEKYVVTEHAYCLFYVKQSYV